jgi:hypothetical protein
LYREAASPPLSRWTRRFDRKGNVVPDRRRLESYFGTDDYRSGMPIFALKRSSPGRERFKAARRAARRSS